jgi:hypothetical protein
VGQIRFQKPTTAETQTLQASALNRMRRLIILLLLFGCGQQTGKLDNTISVDQNESELYVLLDQLPTLKTPLTFNSDGQIAGGKDVSDELTSKISTIVPGLNVLGKIYQTKDFIAVIGVAPADIATPVLTTYDKGGKEIDSFFMYPTAGGDVGYYSTNIITLNDNRELFLTDSTLTRKINKEGDDKIPGTDSLSVTMKKFRVTDKGEIKEIR